MRRIRISFPPDRPCNAPMTARDQAVLDRAEHIRNEIVAADVYSDLRRQGQERREDAPYTRWASMAGER